jgi:hypothetical protein
MARRINTYTRGFDIFITRDITKADMVNICNELTEKFDNKYQFEPEPITDGFLYIKNLKYKCMRLSCSHAPWVNSNVMEEWKDNNDIFVKKTTDDNFKGRRKSYYDTKKGVYGSNYYGTCLKSLYDAPAWTYDELKTIKEVLEKYDMKTTNIKEIKLNPSIKVF